MSPARTVRPSGAAARAASGVTSRATARARARRAMAGRNASKVGPSRCGIQTWSGSQAAASTFASARALRTPRMSSTIAPTSASVARSRSPTPGQRAMISSSGSEARCGIDAQSASVTNGMTGWSSRRYVSSASTRVHHVASRSAAGVASSARRTLASSRPQSQNSLQIASYRIRAASPNACCVIAALTSATAADAQFRSAQAGSASQIRRALRARAKRVKPNLI